MLAVGALAELVVLVGSGLLDNDGAAASVGVGLSGPASPDPHEQREYEESEEEDAAARAAVKAVEAPRDVDTDEARIAKAMASMPARPAFVLSESITPHNIDWLHIPKTGSTFMYAVLQIKCDVVLGLGSADEQWAALESIRQSVTQGKGGMGRVCSQGLRYYHRPLRPQPSLGHQNGAVDHVVSFVREPAMRAASGLLHDYHDCKHVGHRFPGLSLDDMCVVLGQPEGERDASVFAHVKQMVYLYAQCIEACNSHMVLGRSCSSRAGRADSLGVSAAAKLRHFAFVGVTGRWKESVCVFEKRFPRPLAATKGVQRPYLHGTLSKIFRISKRKACEANLADLIHSLPVSFIADAIVYREGVSMLEEALQRYPECRADALSAAALPP